MALALMKYETIDSDQIDDIMSGREPREPKDWGDSGSAGKPSAQAEPKDNAPRQMRPLVGRPANTKRQLTGANQRPFQ